MESVNSLECADPSALSSEDDYRPQPISAREAHERLEFKNIKIQAGESDITSGRAEEKKIPGGTFYALWAAATVKDEIHKAGWRLAALLEEALQ